RSRGPRDDHRTNLRRLLLQTPWALRPRARAAVPDVPTGRANARAAAPTDARRARGADRRRRRHASRRLRRIGPTGAGRDRPLLRQAAAAGRNFLPRPGWGGEPAALAADATAKARTRQ